MSKIQALVLLIICGAVMMVAGLKCGSGKFPDANSCHPCRLCEDRATLEKTPGCSVCASSEGPQKTSCDDDMFYHLRMKTCIHCLSCRHFTEERRKIVGCDQCDNINNAQVKDSANIELKVKDNANETSVNLHTPSCDGNDTFFHMIKKKCVHCVQCRHLTEAKRNIVGCDHCGNTSVKAKDPADVQLQVEGDPGESGAPKLVTVGIVVGSAFVILVLFLLALFIIRPWKRLEAQPHHKENKTSIDAKGFAATVPSSVKTTTEVVAIAPKFTSVTTKINISDQNTDVSSSRADSHRNTRIIPEQHSRKENDLTMDTPITESGSTGRRPDDTDILKEHHDALKGTPV